DNAYHSWGGTSASSPIVAAAVALTQAHFPHYSGFQAAQRVRITADDVYAVNPGYRYKLGQGRVNMFQALSAPALPAIRIEEGHIFDQDGDQAFAAGDTLVLNMDFRNHLDSAQALQVRIRIPSFYQNYIEVLDSVHTQGVVGAMEGFASGDALRIRLKPGISEDFPLAIQFHYQDPVLGYQDFEVYEFWVNASWLNVTANHLHTTLTSRGNIGFNDFIFQQQGLGLRYKQRRNVLFEGGFLVGTNSLQVSDHIRNLSSRDSDFLVLAPIEQVEMAPIADFEASTRFNDETALVPLGVEVDCRAFAFSDSAYRDFILLRYILTNTGPSPITPVYAGLFADWDIAPYFSRGNLVTRNACSYDLGRKLVYAFDRTGADPTYYGMSLLSSQAFRSYVVSQPSSFFFNGAGKFQALSNVPSAATATAGLSDDGVDLMQFISGGVGTMNAGQSDTLVFALLAQDDLAGLFQAQTQAAEAYRCRVRGEGPNTPFALSDSLLPPGQSLQLTDQNPGADSWSWDFGDGNTATGATATHTYAAAGTYSLSLVVTRASCTERHTRTLTVTGTNALADAAVGPRVRLFPNPSRGHMTVETQVPSPIRLRLTDLQGRVLQAGPLPLQGQRGQVSLDGLASGVYLLHLQGAGWQEVHQVYLLP
ncbi:MAG: PKD domain-containing protein, partial [Bacteroidetes bacterium]